MSETYECVCIVCHRKFQSRREYAGGVKQRLLRMAMDARRRAGWPDGRGMVDVRP